MTKAELDLLYDLTSRLLSDLERHRAPQGMTHRVKDMFLPISFYRANCSRIDEVTDAR